MNAPAYTIAAHMKAVDEVIQAADDLNGRMQHPNDLDPVGDPLDRKAQADVVASTLGGALAQTKVVFKAVGDVSAATEIPRTALHYLAHSTPHRVDEAGVDYANADTDDFMRGVKLHFMFNTRLNLICAGNDDITDAHSEVIHSMRAYNTAPTEVRRARAEKAAQALFDVATENYAALDSMQHVAAGIEAYIAQLADPYGPDGRQHAACEAGGKVMNEVRAKPTAVAESKTGDAASDRDAENQQMRDGAADALLSARKASLRAYNQAGGAQHFVNRFADNQQGSNKADAAQALLQDAIKKLDAADSDLLAAMENIKHCA